MGKVLVYCGGVECGSYLLGERPLAIGASEDCQIVVHGNGVCPHHAMLIEKDGLAGICKSESDAETKINNRSLDHASQLSEGDQVCIGDFVLQYYSDDSSGIFLSEGMPSHLDPEKPGHHTQPPTDYAHFVSEDDEDDEEEHHGHHDDSSADASLSVGEFEEADAGEFVEMEISGSGTGVRLTVPPQMLELVRKRLSLYAEIDGMEAVRTELIQNGNLPEAVEREYSRQRREAQNPLSAERAMASLTKTREKIAAIDAAVESQEEENKDVEPLDPMLREALEMGIRQWEFMIRHDELLPELFASAQELMNKEPLYWVLNEHEVSAKELFGWALYALALESISASQFEKRKHLKSEKSEIEKTRNHGMFGRFRKDSTSIMRRMDKAIKADDEAARVLSWDARELASIEKQMVAEFWKIYEEAAVLLVTKRMGPQEETQIRSFLRYGMLGCHPYFIRSEIARNLLERCSKPIREWDIKMAAGHIAYADEYLWFVAHGLCTPAIDEDLELTQRNTPKWKADKAWRRIIYSKIREAAMTELASTIKLKISSIRATQKQKEKALASLAPGSLDYKKIRSELAQAVQHCRVEAARYERAVIKIEDDFLPRLCHKRSEAEERLEETGVELTPEMLVRREVKGVRRATRLAANLKDSFLPFILRDNYKPENDVANEREVMEREIATLEKLDPSIFLEPLLNVKKREHRLNMRFCPIILLSPGCGFLAYSWNPRAGSEVGRLVVPAYCPRQGLRERIIQNMAADFRWDTSRASAGVDLLTSDTLVAAYATVRWEYRKKGKEFREKAGIFNEENDRKNWRRHYGLHFQSALDGGKKLFFKCYEAYERVILPYVDLPEGVERLRR